MYSGTNLTNSISEILTGVSNVSLKDLKLAETNSDNTESPSLLSTAKDNVTFVICAHPPQMSLNVVLIALLVDKHVLIHAKLEKLSALLVVFILVFEKKKL